jgi:serine/threonine-protein kinase
MNSDQWNRVQTLFKEIIDLDPDSRNQRLESVKTESPILFEELQSLLAADSQDTSLLDGFAIEQVDLSDLVPMEGVQVGPFEVIETIGTGGMGNVYRAKRVQGGFEQTVALKLIKYGMGNEQAIRRFESERSILARLQHPNIARLTDGGITDEDRPWFAMEYIEGETLLSYCRRLDLPVRQCLDLFLDVTEAVQYAHKNLVVHHDLKPGNIMVTGEEENPQVRLLDFGIAQILEGPDGEPSESRAMTRAYASPEQLRGDATSTASDIYSLGVILYQLLSGTHPDESFQNGENPGRPLDSELSSICTKAMKQDPNDRYENASDLGDDLQAWMQGRLVITYSTKPFYRFSKWTKRNRAASFIAIFSLISTIILVFVYTQELREETARAQDEATRSARLASVLGSSLLSMDPMQNGGQELTARRMVDMSTDYINNELEEDPQTRSELLIMMADIYSNLLVYDAADSLSKIALDLFSSTSDTTTFEYINMLADRSIILDKSGQYDEGLAMIHRAVDLANRHLDPNSLEFASVNLDYGYHLDVNQDFVRADSVLTLIESIYEQHREEAGADYDDFIFYRGLSSRRLGEYDEAEEYLFRSLELSRERYSGNHEKIASTLNHLSSLYQNMGRPEDGIPYAKEAHAMRLEIFGESHLNTLAAHSNTARALGGAGQLEEAAETYREILGIFREEYGNDNFYIAGILQSYGAIYMQMEDYSGAESIMRESLEHSERLLPADHIRQSYPLNGLADALRKQNLFEEAISYAERAFELRENQLTNDDPNLASSRLTYGICLWNLDRRDEAESVLVDALSFFETDAERYAGEIEEIEGLGL